MSGCRDAFHVTANRAKLIFESCDTRDTTMINCTASFSNRMQTSLKIDRCKFTGYNECYGMSAKEQNVEGPRPVSIRITRSEFEIGRGAGFVAKCGGPGPLTQTCIQKIHIEDCVFNAPVQITKARSITLLNNRYQDTVKIGDHENLKMRGNTLKGVPFAIDAAGQKRNSGEPEH